MGRKGLTTLAMSRDDHIAALKRSIVRHETELNRLVAQCPPWVCCPSCALGRPFSDLCDAQERRLDWLMRLLYKRGKPGDVQLAQAIGREAWP
jgi:hypothetical protein